MHSNPPPAPLPTAPEFIDQLITKLSNIQPLAPPQLQPDVTTTSIVGHRLKPVPAPAPAPAGSNVFSRLSPTQLAQVKPLLLTLHCLFPNDILPALDILDRRLVQQVRVRVSGGRIEQSGFKESESALDSEAHAVLPGSGTVVRSAEEQGGDVQDEVGHTMVSGSTGDSDPRPLVSATAVTAYSDTAASRAFPQQQQTQFQSQSQFQVAPASAPASALQLSSESKSGSVFLVTSTSSAAIQQAHQPSTPSTLLPPSVSPSIPMSIPSIHNKPEPTQVYEVRLHAWNCTCPTFTFSAFRDLASRQASASTGLDNQSQDQNQSAPSFSSPNHPFGGTLTSQQDRASPPVCKHLLACLLFIRCPGLFQDGGFANLGLSREELAGWCAGWGG
ncbi:hypothetical protein POX_e06388 [Penicillium oxalicum]|uniref:hypothetical protein n=1 Tax=Penicillium oxalicum TaxID=69781 RepID=UPI0020B63E8A|nr:hypothetical protein POX_e06388 [Penicillium oxalicum]KAI2788373.1 hypothetical protein POX_e06388 [Penicillium oxalicum]